MSGMVERVALAIHDALGNPADIEAKAGCIELARAAIAAMRGPTEAMVNAAILNEVPVDEIGACWTAMIDGALK